MAPIADTTYFPPLDRCLAGETRLISWRTAYRALCDEDSALSNSNLEQFLADNDTVALLSNALHPFPGPSQKSMQELDTRTAPINVSQNSNGHYKLDEIKADTKWLAKEMQVDELVALRMAVIEWQERAADQLLNTSMNPPSASSGPVVLSSSALGKSSFNFAASTTGHSSRPALDFANEDIRRRRLVDVYLSEKNHLLKLSTDLVTRSAVGKSDIQGQHVGSLQEHTKRTWMDDLATNVFEKLCSSGQRAEHEAFCTKTVESIGSLLDTVRDTKKWPKRFQDNSEEAQVYLASVYTELVALLRLLLANLYALDGIPSAPLIRKWYSTMDNCDYLNDFAALFADCEAAQLLASVISLEILKLQFVIEEIMRVAGVELLSSNAMEGAFYIKDNECMSFLTTAFHRAATSQLVCAAPAIYAWSIMTSIDWRSELEHLYSEVIVVREWEAGNSTTPQVFLRAAVDDMNVNNLITILSSKANALFGSDVESATGFICKEALLDLLREGLDFAEYEAPVLDAILSTLTPAEFCSTSVKQSSILASKIYHDNGNFRTHLLDQTLLRYPYELSPLLRLFTALAGVEDATSSDELPKIVSQLDSMPAYTQIVHTMFSEYALSDPQDGNNGIVLNVDVPMFVERGHSFFETTTQRALPSNASGSDSGEAWRAMFVPEGTTGRIVKPSKPYILHLRHQHSGLEYLGLLLSTFAPSSEIRQAAPGIVLDPVTAAEIVTLFTSLLSATLEQSTGDDNATHLLGRLSAALRNEQDIVTVISEVLESELLAHLDQKVQEGSLEVVTSCIQFLNQLVKVYPERVWSILVRSSLLGVQDGAVSLASVVGGSEIPVGRYQFLDACTLLHSLLLDDALAGLVKRKAVAVKSNHRFAQAGADLDATPDRTMSAVLNSYQKILLDVLQNLPHWKFHVRQERCSIAINILDAFSKLLRCTFGVDVAKDPSKRLTNVLAPAAEALLGVCAPQSGSSPVVSTFGRLLPEGLPIAEDGLPIHIRGLLIEQVKSSFQFLTLLIRTAKAGINLSATGEKETKEEEKSKAATQRTINLASDMVKHFPTLVSLLVSDHSLKADLFPLLSEVLEAIGSGDEDPPSILAQLEPKAQEAFLSVTTQLDRPLCDVRVERRVWEFLSTVMSSKQSYFAAFLLTGQLPKKRVDRHESNHVKTKSILTHVLDQLAAISILPPERGNGMLKFVATSQQVWVWANTEIRSHPDFLKNTLTWIDTLGVAPRDPSPGSSIIFAKECEMASYLCNIFAISIHAGQETGDKTVLKSLIPKLSFLREHAVTVNAYNRSLHRNLSENLKRKFPQAELSDFKRTTVNPATYGTEFFYDRGFATSVLSHDVSWHGGNKGRSQGFSDEFARANANLSLLDAQTKLLTSWKAVAITICELADEEPSTHPVLAEVAEQCLLANADPQLDQPGAADVLNERIELAFVLCSKVVALKVQDQKAKDLVKAAWELVNLSPVDFDIATVSEDVNYYRQLLQVLYLTILPHGFVGKAQQGGATSQTQLLYLDPEISAILVSIIGKVVAPGFRALCANLHTDPDLALPADFALLTALLQAVISVPGISSVHTRLSDIVADSSLIRGALSLYSWSDQLAESTAHDPIFGEVAVMFLLALSTVPPIAVQIALSGALTQLSASNLSNYFRKPGGKGPFDEPQRMFVIWSEGFLPICLNLLDAVGPPIAAEVGAFLNSFSEQLHRAGRSLRNETPSPRNPRAGAVTLGLVAEANSLAMLSAILDSDEARAAAEGINAADIPALEYDVEAVKALVEALSRKRNLSERLTPTNALEERWSKTVTNGTDNVLLQKALKEIEGMLAVVGGSDP
ncbi:hypothetical protein M409DRAFT_64877 [Zasmidium cellare ATCC 36951]|uniref:Uncharacterized protein n=1 Tax=Zasmidium cellare ATCC 36951 TaxID=1080233 RepID=A0A6A6CS57_ZASCE|nr:uncharacterized protein M409DRAFT_64877 [Zasmidium cellare ATCC 36951]KAF2169905.1 hypothetical protein M409DRAFT_64877 [Zasmidium cellare ATCC 36951]